MKLITFGEIMGRICPTGFNRFAQSMPGKLEISFAGAEANVAVSYAYFGGDAAFVSAVPDHDIGLAALRSLQHYGVDTQFVQKTNCGRLGLYFVETGANQRPGRVIYDRDHSAIAQFPANAYRFEQAFAGADALHITGITPALSQNAADATLLAAQIARAKGLQISCDLNFRQKLWRWDASRSPKQLAADTLQQILPFVDLLIANESDAEDVLGISAGASHTSDGIVDHKGYIDAARQICTRFPNIKRVAFTLRESISASHNNWSAMLYQSATDKANFAPLADDQLSPYQIHHIVDRVGAGD